MFSYTAFGGGNKAQITWRDGGGQVTYIELFCLRCKDVKVADTDQYAREWVRVHQALCRVDRLGKAPETAPYWV